MGCPAACGIAPMPTNRSGCSFTLRAIMSFTLWVICNTRFSRRSPVGTAHGLGDTICRSVPTSDTSAMCACRLSSRRSSEKSGGVRRAWPDPPVKPRK